MTDGYEFSELAEKFVQRAEKIGLYAVAPPSFISDIAAADISEDDDPSAVKLDLDKVRDMLKSGEAKVAMAVHFSVNDVAFSDRVQNPDKYDVDKQFKAMMPSTQEMKLERLREKAASGDILDMFLEEED